MPVRVNVLTLNLRNVADRYAERRPMLISEFAALAPDLAALQEVSFNDADQHGMLATSVSGRVYRAFEAQSDRFPGFGNAILTAVGEVPVVEDLRLERGRVALRTLVLLPSMRALWFVSTHLHHRPAEPDVRRDQALRLCDWLLSAPAADGIVLAGDFNAPPSEPAYRLMLERGFRSAHAEATGAEPDVTWPSGIQAEGMDVDGEPACLDYIWLSGNVACEAARLAFNRPAANDPTLFASDHFGVLASLVVG